MSQRGPRATKSRTTRYPRIRVVGLPRPAWGYYLVQYQMRDPATELAKGVARNDENIFHDVPWLRSSVDDGKLDSEHELDQFIWMKQNQKMLKVV